MIRGLKVSKRRLAWPVALLALASITMIGCGGGDSTTTTTTTAETAAEAQGGAGGTTLEIKMGDFFFDPKNATATAGSTVIKAPNEGATEHELVVFKTNMDPAKLPTEANGEVAEEKLDKEAEAAGEITDVEPGKAGSKSYDLTPGKYVMFCNLPGHYALGMYGTITVTK